MELKYKVGYGIIFAIIIAILVYSFIPYQEEMKEITKNANMGQVKPQILPIEEKIIKVKEFRESIPSLPSEKVLSNNAEIKLVQEDNWGTGGMSLMRLIPSKNTTLKSSDVSAFVDVNNGNLINGLQVYIGFNESSKIKKGKYANISCEDKNLWNETSKKNELIKICSKGDYLETEEIEYIVRYENIGNLTKEEYLTPLKIVNITCGIEKYTTQEANGSVIAYEGCEDTSYYRDFPAYRMAWKTSGRDFDLEKGKDILIKISADWEYSKGFDYHWGIKIKDWESTWLDWIDASDKLILHMNGANASTTFTDSSWSSHTVTSNSSAFIETARAKFGTGAGAFNGAGAYVESPNNADWNLGGAGAGDFTIDFWVNITDGSTYHNLMGTYIGPSNGGYQVYWNNDNTLHLWAGTGTDTSIPMAITAGKYYHIAIVRSGSTITGYLNGNKSGTWVDKNMNNDGGFLGVGQNGASTDHTLNGFMDEFRISKGVARWTANFTAPTSEYAEQFELSTCSNLTDAGVYKMTAPITDAAKSCFNISTSDTWLDCVGWNNFIDGTDVAATAGVDFLGGNLTNVTIKNCNFTDWNWGIDVDNTLTENYTLENNTFKSNTVAARFGIAKNGMIANNTDYSSGTQSLRPASVGFVNNTILNNSFTQIIYTTSYAGNNTYKDNTVRVGNIEAIYFDICGESGNRLINNNLSCGTPITTSGCIFFESCQFNEIAQGFISANARQIAFLTTTIQSNHNLFYDLNITGTGSGINYAGATDNITFINFTTFGVSSGTSSNTYIKWYAKITVTNSSGQVEPNVNLSFYEKNNVINYSKLSASNGIVNANLTEYLYRTSNTYYSNYTLNASKAGYLVNSTALNISGSMVQTITIDFNIAPIVQNISITPATAYTNSSLNCSADYGDSNNNKGNVTITWYNGSAHYSNTTVLNIVAGQLVSNQTLTGIQAKGETWNCTVNATDAGDLASLPISITRAINNIAPSITLYAPLNRTNTSDSTPDFIFNYTDADVNGTNGNCILYVNATNVGSNSSTVSSKNTTITSSALNNGMSQQWYVNCSDELNTTQSSGMIIGIDTIAPVISVSRPIGEYFTDAIPYINLNITFNYTELNKDACWYYLNTSNLTIANCLNTSINISITNNLTMYVYINDSSGNESYNVSRFSINLYNTSSSAGVGNATEGDEVIFTFQINSTNITEVNATFYYNNTSYNYGTRTNNSRQANFTKTFSIPQNNGTIPYYWNYTLNSFNNLTEKKNISVIRTDITNCTSGINSMTFWMKDETNSTAIVTDFSTAITYWTNDSLINRTLNISMSSRNNYSICISPNYTIYMSNLNVEYSNTIYSKRYYYLINATLNNVTQNIDLYSLLSSQATLTSLEVYDQYTDAIKDVIIHIQRYDIVTNSYYVVGMARTSHEGKDIAYLNWYDTIYKFLLFKNNALLQISNPQKIGATPVAFIVTTIQQFPYDEFDKMQYSLTFNNDTSNFILTFADSSGQISAGCLKVINRTSAKDEILYDSCVSSASGTLYYHIDNNVTASYFATFYSKGSPPKIIDSISKKVRGIQKIIYDYIGNLDGTVLAIIFSGTAAFAGLFNPVLSIIFIIAGLFGAMSLGFTLIEWSVFWGVAIIGGIIIWKLKT